MSGTIGTVERRALRASAKDCVNSPRLSWWVTDVT